VAALVGKPFAKGGTDAQLPRACNRDRTLQGALEKRGTAFSCFHKNSTLEQRRESSARDCMRDILSLRSVLECFQ